MLKFLLAAVIALLALSPAQAQFAPPGIGGAPRGSAFCQYLTSPPTLTNGSPSLFQCNNLGQQITVGAGTPGTPAGGVFSMQGVSGGTNLPVSQATAASLNATVVGTGTFAVQATQSGNWAARIVGNSGAVLDFAGQNAASPANSLLTGCQFNTSPTTITSGNSSPVQCDNGGDIKVNPGTPGTWGLVAVGGAASPTNGMVAGGIFNTTLPTITATNGAALQLDGFARLIEAPKTLLGGTLVKGTTSAMTGTTSTQIIAAVTSQHIYATNITCNNSSSTATLVTIQDGSGGTALGTLIAPAGGGDEAHGYEPLFWTTAGNGLYAADVTTGASVICTASGHSSAN
jgi:hypothetical protein